MNQATDQAQATAPSTGKKLVVQIRKLEKLETTGARHSATAS